MIYVTETLDIIRFAVAVTVLIPACISDWKRREVSDAHWAAIGIIGIICMISQMISGPVRIEHVMVTIGTAMILTDILWVKDRGIAVSAVFYAIMAVMFIVPVLTARDDPGVMMFMTIPAAFMIFAAMFCAGVLKGGADAKCLIVLAILFPSCPSFFGYPLIAVPDEVAAVIFQFPLAVLFHAALFSLSAGIYYAALNIMRGDTDLPYMFLGFRMDASEAKDAHVWPMHTAGGEVTSVPENRIWVTAMIPFIIPLTVSAVFVMFIGNVLFLLPF